ncbi:hypothetical protein IP92_04867 [Pseudoduganella flava]|uniref:Uncharacterized protein n=1 Tax=Pseudoduganella flava TaxID=871742 RepID=A0A562PHK1_9BURK|nr:hypothetical protein [Pseudoduganella flava]QGZ42653.1 hypothetical protein GO485_28875 [Pseudoduganella flava]TWI43813.1 hypothetical protein IP92_04867 [Pseudoduganella flava]
MPDLSKSAAALFMAELSAHAIIDAIDVSGGLSSSFSVRHKVREANIKALLERCAGSPSASHERVLALAYLLCFACGAYSGADLATLYRCRRDSLKDTVVSPHYGGNAMLRNACVAEPMNLWLGATKENLQMNKQIFDPHYVDTFKVRNDTYESPVPIVQPAQPATTNDAYLASMTPHTTATLRPATLPPNVAATLGQLATQKPALKRTLTPTSATLRANIGAVHAGFPAERWVHGRGELIGPEQVVDHVYDATFATLGAANQRLAAYHRFLATSFTDAIKLVKDTTMAGRKHYRHLYQQLKLRGVDDTHPNVVCIQDARQGWRANRAELTHMLDTHLARLLAAPHQIGWNHATDAPSLPPGFFLAPS